MKDENSVNSFILPVLFAALEVESLVVILCYYKVMLVASGEKNVRESWVLAIDAVDSPVYKRAYIRRFIKL